MGVEIPPFFVILYIWTIKLYREVNDIDESYFRPYPYYRKSC